MTRFLHEAQEPVPPEKKGWYYEKLVVCRVPENTHKNVVGKAHIVIRVRRGEKE